MSNTPAIPDNGEIQPLATSAATPMFTTAGTIQLGEWAAELDFAHKMGTAMAHSNFLPQSLMLGKNKQPKPKDELANDAAVVILAGKSVGLDPLQSVQNIFPVHGQPSMYARTMSALVIAHGHEVRRGSATDDAVTYAVRRKGDKDWQEFTWTTQRAQKAGYTSNKKYESDPIAMLGAKALAEACRTVFPDVLLGMAYSVEDMELEDLGETQSAPAPVAAPKTITRKPRAKTEPAPAPAPVAEPAQAADSAQDVVDTTTGEVQEPAPEPAQAQDVPLDYAAELTARYGDKKALRELYTLAKKGGQPDEVLEAIAAAGSEAA